MTHNGSTPHPQTAQEVSSEASQSRQWINVYSRLDRLDRKLAVFTELGDSEQQEFLLGAMGRHIREGIKDVEKQGGRNRFLDKWMDARLPVWNWLAVLVGGVLVAYLSALIQANRGWPFR